MMQAHFFFLFLDGKTAENPSSAGCLIFFFEERSVKDDTLTPKKGEKGSKREKKRRGKKRGREREALLQSSG